MKLLSLIAGFILFMIGIFVGVTINSSAGTVIVISAVLLVIGVIAWQEKKEVAASKKGLVAKKLQEKNQARQEVVQRQIDNKVDKEVKRLYAQYGEEWINNAGRSRLAMAIDEMLGPAPRRDSNASRAQRTLASAILETVLERKGEIVRQQQAVSREGSQEGVVVDPMLAADIVDTAQALAADADYTNDLDGVDEVDDFDTDDLDDVDDVDDIDLDID